MRLSLRAIAWEDDATLRVTFDDRRTGSPVSAVATLSPDDHQVLAVEPDVFLDCDGSADDVRRVIAALRAFAAARGA